MRKIRTVTLSMFLILTLTTSAAGVTLRKGRVGIRTLGKMPDAVNLAIGNLQNDFMKVMGFVPEKNPVGRSDVQLLVVCDDVETPADIKPLEGTEAHEVVADGRNRRVIIHGHDMRGTIFAIYTFSEQVLGVPPLWYYCDWNPVRRTSISTDINFKLGQPQVRFRAWFPNDTDLFTPWRKLSRDNNERWLEAMLRLKLNCVELETTVDYPDYKMTDEAMMVSRMGIVLTSHHHVALNNSFARWDEYWREVRHQEPPKPSIHRLLDLIDFWTYNVKTVRQSGIENLWQVTFRGRGDQPFWAFFDDAPKTDKERGEVISMMMQIQVDIIKQVTGEEDPHVRTTFYDEMSNLLAQGYIQPPKGKNMIWTYVAARRDHYPNDDVVNFNPSLGMKLGCYFNYQFTSTGSHLAACESPWKMEFNYRYLNSKCPLIFSVVNAGNVREHLTELAANAKMMWDYDQYDTDRWLVDYCSQYFGKTNAKAAAQLYREFYNAYWQPKPTVFPGMKSRQFNFQDMRYARVMDQIISRFSDYSDNPLQDIGFESVKGRTFRIQGSNQVDTLIKNMEQTMARFDVVAKKCEALEKRIDDSHRTYFHDNLTAQANFMAHISHSLYLFLNAYKQQADKDVMCLNVRKSLEHLQAARESLYSTHHGVFSDWYTNDRLWGFEGKIKGLQNTLDKNQYSNNDKDIYNNSPVVSDSRYHGTEDIQSSRAGNRW